MISGKKKKKRRGKRGLVRVSWKHGRSVSKELVMKNRSDGDKKGREKGTAKKLKDAKIDKRKS